MDRLLDSPGNRQSCQIQTHGEVFDKLWATRHMLMRLLWEDPADIINRALRLLCDSLYFNAVDSWVLGGTGNHFTCEISWRRVDSDDSLPASRRTGWVPQKDDGVIAEVSVHGGPRWIHEMAEEPAYCQNTSPPRSRKLGAGVAFRIGNAGPSTRVVVLFSGSQTPLGPDEIQLLAETGAELGRCLERRRIAEESQKADRAFFEDAPIPYHEIDTNGIVTCVNQAECDLLGRDPDELIGKPVWELVSPDDREASRENVLRRLREGSMDPPFERRFLAPNGEEQLFRVHARPIITRSGEVAGLRTAMLDVTAVKNYRQQVELQSSLLDQVNDAILMLETDFRIRYLNTAAERLFGYSAQEAVGQQYKTIAGTVVTQAEREAIHADILGRGSWSGEFICTKRDGTQFVANVSWSVLRDSNGTATGIVGFHRDITAPKQMEQALRVTEDRLAAIVECADAAIISQDLNGIVLTWNRGAERVYGYTAEEIVGRETIVLVPPDRLDEEAMIRDRLRRGDAISHLDTVRLTKSGKPIPLLLTISPIRDGKGNATGAAHVAWDLTHLKQLEQQLAQVQKLESIGQLAAGIAHEINTPMQFIGDSVHFLRQSFDDLWRLLDAHAELLQVVESVAGFAEHAARVRDIEEGADLPYLHENVPRALERTLGGIDQVSSIVGAMKEFAHPRTNQKCPADINKALSNALVVSRNEYKYVAELKTDFESIPQVPCRIGELNQVFLNLIINAAHAVGDVVKGTDRRGEICVSTRLEEDHVAIRIEDTGNGIPPEIRERVFDPFFTTKAVGKGSGQGLAISRSIIVDKHGGTLTFETEVGRGTAFVIRLPLSEPDSVEEADVV